MPRPATITSSTVLSVLSGTDRVNQGVFLGSFG
jgi:hypothetical protein